MQLRAQEAIESKSASIAGAQPGEGATQSCSGTIYCPGNRLETIARAEPPFCCAPERCDVLVAPLFARQKEGLLGQGATQLCCGTTYRTQLGQGATEYLVLLAVVLIVALVSVALLGFFPGMASDAQIAQSKAYWAGASPIAIIETDARARTSDGISFPYLRIRNNGAYPIRLTGIIGADGAAATTFYALTVAGCTPGTIGYYNISDYGYMAPGEEQYFAYTSYHGTPCNRRIISGQAPSSGYAVGGAASLCQNSSTSPGTLDYKTFGFEYIEYIDGQQITKRQIGKELAIKCRDPY